MTRSAMQIWKYAIMAVVMFLYLFPLLNLLNVSLKEPMEFMRNPTALTQSFHFANYLEAWERGRFGNYLLNSIVYTFAATVGSLLLALLAAFPISRKYVRGTSVYYVLFISGLFLPNGMIPQFQLMLQLGLYDNPLSFILVNLNFFFTFMLMVGYLKSVPTDLDAAASVDGCGYFRFLFSIILPIIRPVLATGAIVVSIGVWNNIISAVIYFSDKKWYPIVLGLFAFYGQYSNEWTVLSAAILIVAFPLIVLFVLLQKQFIQGALAGSIKA